MAEPDWERVQKKTFTKWCNTHLNKAWGAEHLIEDVITAWENGIPLMELAVALYKENDKHPEQAISMPVLKDREKNATTRIQKITNLNTAIALLQKAGVAMRGVSAENLCDHEPKDKPTILGMIFMIILDYASRGFGGSSAEVKRALLEWVNKKTDGYAQVNPPGVKNFTKDWRNGLAWCALIHRHRPELIDYDKCLTQSNKENLEMAFSVADTELGIPRLLDVDDMDVAEPDEKSVITYTMEYFLRFANEGLKEAAAKQCADWLKLLRDIIARQNDYERRARLLLKFVSDSCKAWDGAKLGDTATEAAATFMALRAFVTQEKPPQEGEKMDLEALFFEIQTTLQVNNLAPYVPPADVTPECVETGMASLAKAQAQHAAKTRENRFRFIKADENESGAAIEAQIEESFNRYDSNKSGTLSKAEFDAACMELGFVMKSQEEKDAFFDKIAEGKENMEKASYKKWMTSRLVVNVGDPESIKNAFKSLADGAGGLTEGQLGTQPLTPEDKEFLIANMTKNAAGQYDYEAFVNKTMNVK